LASSSGSSSGMVFSAIVILLGRAAVVGGRLRGGWPPRRHFLCPTVRGVISLKHHRLAASVMDFRGSPLHFRYREADEGDSIASGGEHPHRRAQCPASTCCHRDRLRPGVAQALSPLMIFLVSAVTLSRYGVSNNKIWFTYMNHEVKSAARILELIE